MSTEKGGWLPNKKIYINNGFKLVDEIEPHFGLYAKNFTENAPKPKFNPIHKDKVVQYSQGVTILYSDQCPYIVDLVDDLEMEFKNEGDLFKAIKFKNCKDAQKNGVYPYGTYCIIYDGERKLYQHRTKNDILKYKKS